MTKITSKGDRYLMKNYLRFPSKRNFTTPFDCTHPIHPEHVCEICGGTEPKPVWTKTLNRWYCSHACWSARKC